MRRFTSLKKWVETKKMQVEMVRAWQNHESTNA